MQFKWFTEIRLKTVGIKFQKIPLAGLLYPLCGRDDWLYAKVCIERIKYTALLDSGATISWADGEVALFLCH